MNGPNVTFTNFLLKYIEPKIEGRFVECGANDGIAGSPCFKLEQNHKWTGINIEANPYCYSNLVKNRPNCINVEAALNNYSGVVEFTLPIDGPRKKQAGQSSLIYKPGHWKRGNYIRPTETYKVECITYDKLLFILKISYIDLFVLDVEGAEINVIEAMTIVLPSYICIEDNHFNDHSDLPFKEEDYIKLMKEKGYHSIDKYKNNTLWKLENGCK